MEEVVCPSGAQRYVPPVVDGVASNEMELPEQIVSLFTVTEGEGFTVTVAFVGAVKHPLNE